MPASARRWRWSECADSFRTPCLRRVRRRGLLRPRWILSFLRGRLPATWLPTSLVVEEHHDRPDLVLGEVVLPDGHGRVPGRAFARKPWAAFRDAPEDVALGELRDGAVVGEVRRRWAEAVGVVARPIETIAMAGDAVLVVDALALAEMICHRAAFPQRILESRELHRLAAEGDLSRRRGVDRAELDWRLDFGTRLLISRETEEDRHGDEEPAAEPSLVLVDERRMQWLLEGAPPELVAADEDEDADDRDEHILKYDAPL